MPQSTVLQNRYRILRLYDQGGSATVYLAERLGMEDRVPLAVKELNPDVFGLAEFKNEVNVLYSLNHPNLPKVYDFFEEDGKHYLVMDFVQGRTLKQRVHESGPLPEDQAIDYALQVCGILSYLHERSERRIIHRDLKPSNLMLTKSGQVKLLDFGIARVPDARLPGDRLHAYTEDYAAPEQKDNLETDERSDIYSFGVTLHFLLTGTVPGEKGVDRTATAERTGTGTAPVPTDLSRREVGAGDDDITAPVGLLPPVQSGTGGAAVAPPAAAPPVVSHTPRGVISREMRRVISRCLRPKPADRYQSFSDLARDLTAYRRAKRNRLVRIIWGVAAVVAIGALALSARLIFGNKVYPVVGPTSVEAGSSVTLQVGLPSAWSGSLEGIVWRVEDTQALSQPEEEQRGRYLSFSSTDLGVFQVQAYLDEDGRRRPLSEIKRIEVYPRLDLPAEAIVGQPLTLHCVTPTTTGGRTYAYSWEVGRVVGGEGAGEVVTQSQTTTVPMLELPNGLPEVGDYTVKVSAAVQSEQGIEVTVAGQPRGLRGVTEIAVDQTRVVNVNGSFEDQQPSGSPVDWSLAYTSHLAYDKTVGRTGSRSLLFSPWTGLPPSYAVQLIPLQAGSSYRITVWAKGDTLEGGAYFTLQADFRSALDGSFVLPEQSVTLRNWAGTFDWRQVSLDFSVPAGDPVNLEIYLRFSGQGTLWVDDCYLEGLG